MFANWAIPPMFFGAICAATAFAYGESWWAWVWVAMIALAVACGLLAGGDEK